MALTQVKTAGIAADAVTGAKIADDAINSEHYVDGSIDNAHIADDQVDSEHYAADSIDTEHYAPNSVDLAAMAGIARGKLIVGDSNGDPSYLTAGSNDQVLTMDANGDVGWEAPAASGATLTGSTDNTIVTVTGANAMQGEANLKYDGSTLTIADVDADNVIELGYGSTGNNNAYIDFVGDTTYTDYGLRLIRTDSGANSSAALVNRGTGALQINAQDAGTVELMQNNTARLEVETDGDVKVNTGNLVIGTSGKGIDFSADGDSTNASGTATGHLLHDYEEGTFDPTSEHAGVTSYNTRGGWYTKVGRVVHYQIYINMTLDSTSSSSDAAIAGLPFASASGTHISASSSVGWIYGLGTNVDHAYIGANETKITLLGPNSNGERDHVSHNEVLQSRASARLCLAGSYWTSA